MKTLLKLVKWLFVVAIIAGVAGAIYLHFTYDIFGFNKKGLVIDKTPIIVEETKKISELTSAHFYEEVIVKDEKTEKGLIFNSKNELVIIAKGNVRAGFNLSKLTEADYNIKGDTISFKLPEPEIFDVIVNPSNYDVFVEEGKWSHDEITKVLGKAQAQIKDDALKNDILGLAKKSGISKLTELYKSFGFSVVNIEVAAETEK